MTLFLVLWFISGIFSGIITLTYFEGSRYLYKFNSKFKAYLLGFLLGPLPIVFKITVIIIQRIKRPKWQHSNSKKGIEAVQKIIDQNILVQIIHDSKALPEVQIEAVNKISDEYVLRDKVLLSGLYFIVESSNDIETRIFCKDFLKPNVHKTPPRYRVDTGGYGVNRLEDYFYGISIKARFTALNRISNIDIQWEMLMMFAEHFHVYGSPFRKFPFEQFFHEIVSELILRIEDEEVLKKFVRDVTLDTFKNLAIKRIDKETLFLFLIEIIEERNVWSYLQTYSVITLGKMKDERAIPILLETLGAGHLEYWEGRDIGEERHYGADALVKLGEKAKAPLLIASQSDNCLTRKWAQWALKQI